MHPVTKTNFGIHGVRVSYYNGSAVVNGYIVKQVGTSKFNVTDGTHPATVTLAQTVAQTTIASTQPTICTIPISGTVSTAKGATFTPTFALDATTAVVNGGAGAWLANDVITVTGGTRPIGTLTMGTLVNPNTITLGGTVITFVVSGATGNQVNIGTTPALTAAALYTMLTGSADTNLVKCNYVNIGAVVTVISKTSGTTNNTFALATNSANATVSGATLSGGVQDPASTVTPPTVSAATVSGGAVTAVTVSAGGAFTAFPTTPTYGYYSTGAGNGRIPVQLTLKFNVTSIASSGGTGYAVGDQLSFVGQVDSTATLAHISAATSGAATTTVVDAPGSGITSAASSIGVLGATEHVKAFYDTTVRTVEGNRYSWSLNSSVNGSAVIGKYS
jgi:hypothetical protein